MEIVNIDARTFESMLSAFEAFADMSENLAETQSRWKIEIYSNTP